MHIEHLFNSRVGISVESLGETEHFEIESRDGVTIRGYITYPPGETRTNLPMVVLPYDEMLGARSYDWFDPDVQVIASNGYAVLQINHRGSAGYGAAYERAGFRKLGTVVQDDIADAVRWSLESGIADSARVCIAGSLFGAYSALMSAAREPELYACAIGHNGLYDLPMTFGAGRLPDVAAIQDYAATVVGTNDEELERQSPITHLNDIRADLLISYERFMRRSPPAQTKALMKALDRAGKDYERYIVQQEYYGIVDDEAREEYYRRMLEFLDKNIGAGP
jgi:dipeptidyl aminopeptidase/acylaminoacyl peptidase